MHDAQTLFFQQIREKLPPHVVLVDEVEETLAISQDSAYRRIRGEKELSFTELQKLCSRFGVSADQSMHLAASDVVSFRYNTLDHTGFTLIDYLRRSWETLHTLPEKNRAHLYYAAKDIPLFHYFYDEELAAFKMFVWQKTLLGFPEFENVKYSLRNVQPEVWAYGRKLLEEYHKIPSTEMWNEETISSLLRQSLFYTEAGLMENGEDALRILDKIEQYLVHLRRQAEAGRKFFQEEGTGAPFALYHNEVVLADNTVVVQAGERLVTYITHNGFNYLATANDRFSAVTHRWMQQLMRKSTLISNVSEKERQRFFSRLEHRVKETRGKVEFLLRQS
jgi:hypothetical protein